MPTNPELADCLAIIEVVQADGTFPVLVPFLATACESAQSSKSINISWCQALLLAHGEGGIILQAADLTPSREDIVTFQLSQITLCSAEAPFKQPGNYAKS